MAERTLKYRELLKRLKTFGVTEGKGKGSERKLTRMVGGIKHSTTTKCHGENDQKPKAVIAAIRRRLRLTVNDGVSDKEFYGK